MPLDLDAFDGILTAPAHSAAPHRAHPRLATEPGLGGSRVRPMTVPPVIAPAPLGVPRSRGSLRPRPSTPVPPAGTPTSRPSLAPPLAELAAEAPPPLFAESPEVSQVRPRPASTTAAPPGRSAPPITSSPVWSDETPPDHETDVWPEIEIDAFGRDAAGAGGRGASASTDSLLNDGRLATEVSVRPRRRWLVPSLAACAAALVLAMVASPLGDGGNHAGRAKSSATPTASAPTSEAARFLSLPGAPQTGAEPSRSGSASIPMAPTLAATSTSARAVDSTRTVDPSPRLPAADTSLNDDATLLVPVHFGVGTRWPSGARPEILGPFVAALRARCGDRPIVLTGHTCDLGPAEGNLILGHERARMVRRVLVDAGLPYQQMDIASAGSHEPISPNDSDAGRRQNRRVTVACPPQAQPTR